MKSFEFEVTEHFTDGTTRVTKSTEIPPLKLPPDISEKLHRIIISSMEVSA